MAIDFVASSTTAGSGGTCAAVPPSGIQEGDFLLAYHVGSVSNQTLAPPVGWAPVTAEFAGDSEMEVSCKFANSSDVAGNTSIFTITNNASSTVIMVAYRSVDVTAPVSGSRAAGTPSLTTNHSLNATTLVPTDATLGLYQITRGSNISWASLPAGWTIRIDQFLGGYDFVLMEKSMLAGQAYGTLTSISSSSTRAQFSVVALKEAAVIATRRKLRIAGSFVDKLENVKVGGSMEEKPTKVKVGGIFI